MAGTADRLRLRSGEDPTGAQLKALYDEGVSIRDIGAVIGRSYSTVHGRLRRAGTKFRPRGGGHGRKDRLRRDYPIDARTRASLQT